MGFRVLYIKADVKLNVKDEHLYLKNIEKDEEFQIILNDIDSLVFETNKTVITTRVITEIAKNNIMTLFCDEKYNPIANILPVSGYYKKYDQVKRQIGWSEEMQEKAWEQIIRNKIINQAAVLKLCGKNEQVIARLYEFASNVRGFDYENNEGLAAKMYFRELFGTSFTRESDTPTNWALNYGYTILLSKFNRAIAAKGLLLEYGIKHENIFNHYNLSSDLMEPLRPIIDYHVYNNTFQNSLFTSDQRSGLVNALNYKIKFGEKFQYITYGIDVYIASFIKFMNGEIENIMKIDLRKIVDHED